MYHTNEAYKTTVANYPQKFNLSIEVTFDESTGLDTVTVPPEDIFEAGFSEELFLSTFCIGSTVEPRFWVRMHNPNGKYSENALATAEIRPCMTLYNEADEAVDTVPIGVLHVTKITAQNSDLRLECMDRMTYLNRLFEPQGVETSLYALGRRIAQTVRAEFKSTPQNLITSVGKRSILQQTVNDSIFKGYSYAQVLSCIAEVCGSFAIFDNEGNLWLSWFKESDVTLTGDFARSPLELNGNTFSMDGNIVQVTGVNVVSEDTELARVGTDEYLLTLNENPIANAMPETAANAVLYRLKNTKYIPCRYERIGGDPSVQLGDILTIIDNKEPYNEANADTYDRYSLFLTSRNWRFNGAFTENYNASGNPDKDLNTDRGMTRSKRLAQLAKRVTEVEKNITEGMTDYEAALLMFNDKLFNAKGLYKTVKPQEDGSIILYFHDETELENSHMIQMFSAAGFAWTTDGWNNGEPLWRYGFTDAGDAILNTINAYILSADIIKTGVLQSQNGASWINMDNGTFCFRSATQTGTDANDNPIYSYENKLLLDDNGELGVYGKLKSTQHPNMSVYIGASKPTDAGMFSVYDSSVGHTFSVFSAEGYVAWTFETFDSWGRGLYFYEDYMQLTIENRYGENGIFIDAEMDGHVYITNDKAYLGVYKGDIQMATNSHDYVWINYWSPKIGKQPNAYKFGDGTGGGLADIVANRIVLGKRDEWDCAATIGGDAVITGSCWANNYYNNSTRDMKKNIQPQKADALSLIKLLKFYSYDYDTDLNQITDSIEPKQSHIDFGLVAEESPQEIKSEDGKAINLYEFISLTAKSVQELSEKVEKQAQEITRLKAEISALKQ